MRLRMTRLGGAVLGTTALPIFGCAFPLYWTRGLAALSATLALALAGVLIWLLFRSAGARSTSKLAWDRMLEAERLASVGKLTAGIVHEIRNPLTAITMWLFSIRRTVNPDPDLERKFEIVLSEVARLESLTRAVLEFSRPPAASLGPLHTSAIIDKTLELVRYQIQRQGLRVLHEEETKVPAVMADPGRLEQVFLNLLSNAMEAMPQGGEIHFRTSLECGPEGAPMVVVRVQDNGPGIPEQLQARIFEPFWTTKEEGTGLGLSIAARIMAELGGRLVLECSTPGRTSFAVWTPTAGTVS